MTAPNLEEGTAKETTRGLLSGTIGTCSVYPARMSLYLPQYLPDCQLSGPSPAPLLPQVGKTKRSWLPDVASSTHLNFVLG